MRRRRKNRTCGRCFSEPAMRSRNTCKRCHEIEQLRRRHNRESHVPCELCAGLAHRVEGWRCAVCGMAYAAEVIEVELPSRPGNLARCMTRAVYGGVNVGDR